MERLIEQPKGSGDADVVKGSNVFVVVGEEVTFIPISDLRNLLKEAQINVIGNAVAQDLTGSDDVTFEQVNTVNVFRGDRYQRRGNPCGW